ncbi:Conserved hypothetical protein [Capnocytophaga canimorsus Cc5]|uniref:Molecular chaperone DnaJ n=2 Tax=Capnocytophaga canimorsus TaxID=28188 RepID=F9YSM5_CAPCC|nr:Conserved hypothetical protein [Capnocytophaga canimorsus Cc5]
MNDTMIKGSLQIAKDSITRGTIVLENNEQFNWWLWIAVFEFVIIILLVVKLRIKRRYTIKQKFKEESLKDYIDFGNIINSSFNSKQLYDELKVKCHPDRFPNDSEKNTIADKLFQKITENQNNVKRLMELKEEAKQKLNINF